MLNLLRVACLLLTLLAIGTGWVWQERSKWIYSFDWHVTKFYERDLGNRAIQIERDLGKVDLESDLAELQEIRDIIGDEVVIGDRYFMPWRKTIKVLTGALMDAGRYSEALPIMEDAVLKDPTNIPLHLRYATALCMVGGAENLAKSKVVTEAWDKKIPSNPDLRAAQMLRMSIEGDLKGLAQSVQDNLFSTLPYLSKGWELFLFPKGEGAIQKSGLISLRGPDEDGMHHIEFEVEKPPSNLATVRLDGPPFTRCVISNIDLTLWVGEEQILPEPNWKFDGRGGLESFGNGTFVLRSGPDPLLRLSYPEGVLVRGPLLARVSFKLGPVVSKELRQFLKDPSVRQQVEQHLNEQGWGGSLDEISPLPTEPEGGQ